MPADAVGEGVLTGASLAQAATSKAEAKQQSGDLRFMIRSGEFAGQKRYGH
jgi:hypothetical protein